MSAIAKDWKKMMDGITEELNARRLNFLKGWALAMNGMNEQVCRRAYPKDWDNGMSAGFKAKIRSLLSK